MGQMIEKFSVPLQYYGANLLQSASRKRKRNDDSIEKTNAPPDLETPKKRRLLTTTQYIYQALFKEQKNSDIAVMALGKVWNLHKVYLCQSPYFYSMFNGQWKESCQDFVHIKILDERITLDALDAVFGSMYSDEIEIDPKGVIAVLATATLFHLDGIIDKCAEVMTENINAETAIDYYETACQYGCMNVKKVAFAWLETNLLYIYTKCHRLLRHISIELMTSLIYSADLYVMQTEFSLYSLLRQWIYLCLHPSFDPENPQHMQAALLQHKQKSPAQQTQQQKEGSNGTNSTGGGGSGDASGATFSAVVQSFFASRSEKTPFLATPMGQKFLRPFQALRTQYLTNHHMDLQIVLNDNIIPKEWLHNHVLSHWGSILKVDHQPEEGPQNLDPEVFNRSCMRCCRDLQEPGYQKWRWTGFNYGLDLILVADSRVLSIRRLHRNEHERLLSLQTKRQFMIRASVTSINAQRQPIFTQKSEILSLNFEKNEEVTLMYMDTKLVHPLLISVNMLVVAPSEQNFKEKILSYEEANAIPISEIGAATTRSTGAAPPSDGLVDSESVVYVEPPSRPSLRPSPAASTESSESVASSTFSSVSSGDNR